jgi:hypothetical protein
MDYLSLFIVKLILLFIGLVGNLIGLVVFSQKKLNKLKTKSIYQALLCIDSIFVFSQIFEDTSESFNVDLSKTSIISCKIVGYWNFAIGAISVWYLLYITIERYVAIKFRNIKLLQNKKFQIFIIILVIVYNLVLYTPFAIFYNIFKNSTLNETIVYCDFGEQHTAFIMFTADLINSTLLPFSIIIIFSCLLIYTILSSRITMMRTQSHFIKKKLLKDIRLSLSIVVLNLNILVTNLPIQISNNFFPDLDDYLYNVFCCIMYTSYCINTYVLFFFNSIFRDELLTMLSIKK